MGAKTRKLSQINDSLIEWQSVVVADGSTGLTAVAGRGYFINTTAGAITVTLPTSSKPGDTVQLKDYARTWGTNNVTMSSNTFDGVTTTTTFSTNGQTVTLVYMDNTKGWSLVNEDTTSTLVPAVFISATGGTVTTSGDFKIHTFTGDGCFVVSTIGNAPTNPLGGPSTVDYLVVAGGGGGGALGGGAGAGGFRESKDTTVNSPHTASPLAATTGITVTTTSYPITVGAGGTAGAPGCVVNGSGSNSVFSTITSAGGGRSGQHPSSFPGSHAGNSGGSGGGGGSSGSTPTAGGSGNTPPTNPSQGNNGGNGVPANSQGGGGGGGATSAGVDATTTASGAGGNGATTSITGSPTTYAGGGGGGARQDQGTHSRGAAGPGGGGIGGNTSEPTNAGSGTANTGGGGGGGGYTGSPPGTLGSGGTGGKGIVVIRYKYQ